MKLYYSDGREVKSGDVVKSKKEKWDDLYSEYLYVYIRDNEYVLGSSFGTIGTIDSVEGYELFERYEVGELKCLINDLSRLISEHDQGFLFDKHLTIAIDELRRAQKLIK